jgi:hypothetical protein
MQEFSFIFNGSDKSVCAFSSLILVLYVLLTFILKYACNETNLMHYLSSIY